MDNPHIHDVSMLIDQSTLNVPSLNIYCSTITTNLRILCRHSLNTGGKGGNINMISALQLPVQGHNKNLTTDSLYQPAKYRYCNMIR